MPRLGLRRVLRSGEKSAVPEFFARKRVCDTIGGVPLAARVVFCLSISLFLISCSSTRPVVKIGLLAPFEGLHRESGYEALSAMRAALADFPLDEFDALPLALDTSADPEQARRAAAKLLRDNRVVAVVGPLQARQVAAVADVLAASDVDWQPPTTPASEEAAQSLIEAIIVEISGKNIIVAGLDFGWPQISSAEWSSKTGKTVTVVDGEVAGDSADGVLWLGSAAEGAAFLGRLRTQNRTTPFWTTAIADDPVFHSLLLERLEGAPPGPIYWAIALGDDSDQFEEWTANHTDAASTAYAVYHATRRALKQIAGNDVHSNEQGLAVFTLNREGKSELSKIVPFP